jgi:hypothetical protein
MVWSFRKNVIEHKRLGDLWFLELLLSLSTSHPAKPLLTGEAWHRGLPSPES